MRRTRRIAVPGLLALAIFAPAAEARRGPCIPGIKKPNCRVWTAKVMQVADGDTVNVRVRENGRWSERRDVRLTGVQAMELTRYSRARGRRGECHAVSATERLEHLLKGPRKKRRRIRLAARRPNSAGGGRRGRLRRAIGFRQRGRWQDAGAVLMREGRALWDPNGREWAWNKRYSKLAQRAALSGRGMYDTDACGSGPHQTIPISLRVKWDADGRDGSNVNGEWFRIRNHDPATPLPLRRWWVRDSFNRRYTFGREAIVPPGGSIRVRVGRGRDRADTFYWGLPDPIFENATRGRRGMGDGGYLFDPHGDLRAWHIYPCRVGCGR